MTFKQWIGVELDEVTVGEKIVSAVGGFVGLVLVACFHAADLLGSTMLIASMGASAVLLFAAPHGPMSQPWPVIVGQTLSACVGVTCAKLIAHPTIAAAAAVGFAIGAMHLLKCLHPPGGATALTAVIGGPDLCKLGYAFCVHPVLVDSLLLVSMAVLFNYPFAWRRYPTIWSRQQRRAKRTSDISHEEVVQAVRSLNSFVDITEEDLVRLVELIADNHERLRNAPQR